MSLNPNVTRFFTELARNKILLSNQLAVGVPGQPAPITITDPETLESRSEVPFIWAASKRDFNHGTTEADPQNGSGIMMLPFSLFAFRFTEGSHVFASPKQIEQFKEFQARRKSYYDSEDQRLNQRRTVHLELPPEPVAK